MGCLLQTGLKEKPAESFEGKLKKARLSTESLLQTVGDIVSNGDTDHNRLQAAKIGLQLNPETRKALNDETGKQVPVFNIVINDNGGRTNLNAIMMPRPDKILDILPEETTI